MNLFGELGLRSDPGESDGSSANSHRQISLPLCMFLDAGPAALARMEQFLVTERIRSSVVNGGRRPE